VSADANHPLVDLPRLRRVVQHAHQRSRILRLIYVASSSFKPFPNSSECHWVNKRMYAYLVLEKVRGKVKGTRKKREEVLPKTNSSMTR
jgi:hypothetical protein